VSLRRTLAITRRIAEQLRRDHRTVALLFVAPVVIVTLLGWVMRDQTPSPTRVSVVNEAAIVGAMIRSRIEAAAATAGIVVDPLERDRARARDALATGDLDLVVVIPTSFPEDMAARQPRLTVITPGVVPGDDASRMAQLASALAGSLQEAGSVPTIERETLFGAPAGDFLDAFAPALVGFVVFFLLFILTGISFLRERIGGTLERLLATPIRRGEIIAGYSLGFGALATLQVAVILTVALASVVIPAIGPLPEIRLGLGIANSGSVVLAFVVTVLLALAAVNLGILISTFARTEFQVLQFIPIVLVPQVLLAGIFWPITSLPEVLEAIARMMPLTYGLEGLREVLVKGAGLESSVLRFDIAVLLGITVVLMVLATRTIRREVA
jgi:ABC-2 type transport system permease protein